MSDKQTEGWVNVIRNTPSRMHQPIKYYVCERCNREFTQPPEGYQGLCRYCKLEPKPNAAAMPNEKS